jgi:hypothetical protein
MWCREFRNGLMGISVDGLIDEQSTSVLVVNTAKLG